MWISCQQQVNSFRRTRWVWTSKSVASSSVAERIGRFAARVCSAGRWTQPSSSRNPVDSAGAHAVPEPGEFALEAAVAPRRGGSAVPGLAPEPGSRR